MNGATNAIKPILARRIDINSYARGDDGDKCTALHLALTSHRVSQLCDANTSTEAQGKIVQDIGILLAYGADASLEGKCEAQHLRGTPVDWAMHTLKAGEVRDEIIKALRNEKGIGPKPSILTSNELTSCPVADKTDERADEPSAPPKNDQ